MIKFESFEGEFCIMNKLVVLVLFVGLVSIGMVVFVYYNLFVYVYVGGDVVILFVFVLSVVIIGFSIMMFYLNVGRWCI